MSYVKNHSDIESLIGPLGESLTPEVAKRIITLKIAPEVKDRIELLGTQSKKGKLTIEEQTEYSSLMSFGMFVTVLKSKARLLLASERATRRKS